MSTEEREAGFVRRTPKASSPRKRISKADVRTALRLVLSVFVSWLLPQRSWPSIARHGSWLAGVLAGKTTKPVELPMARALGEGKEDLCSRLAADLRGARYEVAFQCLRGYRVGGWRPKITVSGRDHLDEALQQNKGCVLWVAHFVFAPNVVKIGLHDLGLRVSHLSRPDHGFSSTRFGIRYLNPVRRAFEDRYLEQRIVFDRAHPAGALMRARRTVAANGIVSFTAGAWEGSSVVESRFFKSRITLAMGPVWLARVSGAVLLPVFAMRDRANNEFLVEIDPPIDVQAASSEQESMVAAARSFLRRHERRVLEHPGQWRGWSSLRDE